MARRNPMNDRYQTDEKTGSTRKSAASAKPAKKAASSVYIQDPNYKPKKSIFDRFKGGDKKREEDAKSRAKAAAAKDKNTPEKKSGPYTLLDMEGDTKETALTAQDKKEATKRFLNPGTMTYKKWRIIWWIIIGLGICSLIPPIALPQVFPYDDSRTVVFYVLGWGFLIAAVCVDALRIRPLRKQARSGAAKDKSKEATAERKELKRQEAAKAAEKERKRQEKEAKKAARKNK